MDNMKKKIVGILVCMLMIVSILPATGIGEDKEMKAVNNTSNGKCDVPVYGIEKDTSNIGSNGPQGIYVPILLDYLDQYQDQCDYFHLTKLKDDDSGSIAFAQSFKPSMPILTRVKVFLKKMGDTSPIEGWIDAGIKSNLSSSEWLRYKKLTDNDIPYLQNWVEIDFEDLTVTPGKAYYICLLPNEVAATEYRYVAWFFANDPDGTLYGRGGGNRSTDGGDWVEPKPFGLPIDFCFATYGTGGNIPPNKPSTPSGPITGSPGTWYTYSTSADDPDDDQVKYYFDWGDGTGTWTSFVASGNSASASHSWDVAGTYQVKAKAQDEHGAGSNWSTALTVTVSGNSAPEDPTITVQQEETYTFTISLTSADPDLDKIKFHIQWGDGNKEETNYINSGETTQVTHTYGDSEPWKPKTYTITVKAIDAKGAESNEVLTSVTMLRVYQNPLPLVEKLSEWLIHIFGRLLLPKVFNF